MNIQNCAPFYTIREACVRSSKFFLKTATTSILAKPMSILAKPLSSQFEFLLHGSHTTKDRQHLSTKATLQNNSKHKSEQSHWPHRHFFIPRHKSIPQTLYICDLMFTLGNSITLVYKTRFFFFNFKKFILKILAKFYP